MYALKKINKKWINLLLNDIFLNLHVEFEKVICNTCLVSLTVLEL